MNRNRGHTLETRAVESVVGGGEYIWIEQRASLDPRERERAVLRTISETSSRSDPKRERSSA